MNCEELVWNGKVPLWIRKGRESYFLLAARISYLPLYDAQISRYFGCPLAASSFAFTNNRPIPWHLPIGPIYDMHQAEEGGERDDDGIAPFLELFVAQTKDGGDQAAAGIDEIASAFYGRLKEADALSSSSSVPKTVPLMGSAQQAAIFDTILTGNLRKHCANRPNLPLVRLPLRLYLRSKWIPHAPLPNITTLSQLMRGLGEGEEWQFIIQGLHFNDIDHSDVSLLDVYKHLAHPDGFLYIIIVITQS